MDGLPELGSRMAQDLRQAARALRSSPGFALTAIVTIGLGVGVNTGIFSLVNAVAFQNLHASEPDELLAINQVVDVSPRGQNNSAQFTKPEYEAYRDRTETLSGALAYGRLWSANLGGETPGLIVATPVSCNFFDVLGLAPQIGGFSAAHCAGSGANVAVLTHDLWVDRFAGDTGILGRTVQLNGGEFQIVGVAPEGFAGIDIDRPSLFIPLGAATAMRPDRSFYEDGTVAWLNVVGRRAAGVSTDQVEAELNVIARQLDLEQPGRSSSVTVGRATPLSAPDMRGPLLGVAAIGMFAFGLVLLVACTNVANLMLARADLKLRDTAIRVSLGATRGRLIRQCLTESVLIAVAGGLVGAMLAVWAMDALLAAAFSALPPEVGSFLRIEPEADRNVFAFALGLSMLAGIGFGILPAFTASRPGLRTMTDQDAGGTVSRKRGRLQGVLVGAQVAFSMVLVVATALLLRGFYETRTVDLGFNHEGLVIGGADIESFGYRGEQAADLQRRAIDQVRALPGVEDVAQALITPLEPIRRTYTWRLPEQAQAESRPVDTNNVSANYFAVTGIPIVRGRAFTDAEVAAERSSVAIVTESTARSFWPGEDPIGKLLVLDAFVEVSVEVVGVARDIQVSSIGETETPYIYTPANEASQHEVRLVVRTALPDSMIAPIAAVYRNLDPRLPVRVQRFEENIAFWTGVSGIVTSLAFGLGSLALVLASIGVFGVMSTVVGRRVREIGIRLALGAGRSDVLRLMLRKSMRPVVFGAALGVLTCFGVARLLSSLLFGVGAFDPFALAGATAAVLGAGFLASALPARRAMAVDPMTTLRYE